jgi:hypothetical protein
MVFHAPGRIGSLLNHRGIGFQPVVVSRNSQYTMSLNSQEFSRMRLAEGLNSCEFSDDESERALSC